MNFNLFPEKEEKINPEKENSVKCHKAGKRQISRKIVSEKALEENIPWHFKTGDCYHCISFGDVDSLSYFKLILKQQKVKYALISTWCMAGEDVNDLSHWINMGLIDRLDFYVGEIFKNSYPVAYRMAVDCVNKVNGRCCVFRNHSKVMVIFGEKFDCVIESSANVNTNPRTENTVITVDTELAEFYKNFFDEIKAFNFTEFPNWKKYEIKGGDSE